MILILLTGLFLCFHQSQSYCHDTSAPIKFFVGNKSSCEFTEDIQPYSVNVLDKVLVSCAEVSFCSFESSLKLHRTLSFKDLHDIAFIGVTDTVIDCDNTAGIEFKNVTNVSVLHIHFQHCIGKYSFISSNEKGHSYNSYWIGILIAHCRNVLIENVTVSLSHNMGMAVFNTTGSITFHKSYFTSNGGTGLLLQISNHDNETCQLNDSFYIIRECSFIGNSAQEISNFPYGRGGGLHISVKCASYRNVIDISDCIFLKNTAGILGGGLYAYFFDNTASNLLMLKSSIFQENNSPEGYGGGYAVGFNCPIQNTKQCSNNTILVDSCYFHNNEALFGGGLSFTSTRTIHTQNSSVNTISHHNCTWINNIAHYGAAIVVLPNALSLFAEGFHTTPSFDNCTINDNYVVEKIINRSLPEPFSQYKMGAGTFYCSQFSITFTGQLKMENNNGSAILASDCSLIFKHNTSAYFSGNSGYAGGALHLIDYSTMYANENNSFIFYNNTAETDGGAIYHLSSEHTYSYICFISILKNINMSTVKFNFSDNLAGTGSGQNGYGNSIYATALLPCKRRYRYFKLEKLFHLSGKNQVASAVTSFSTNTSTSSLAVIPGKYMKLAIEGIDDLGHERTAAYLVTVKSKQNNSVSLYEHFSVATDISIKLLGNPGDMATIQISTMTKQKTVLSFDVTLQSCPPGYVLVKFVNVPNHGCVCSANTDQRYTGINSCNIAQFSAIRNRGYWMGYDKNALVPDDSSFFTGFCPIDYWKYDSALLPSEASREALNDNVCLKNREGVLCSKCKKNTSHYFHSPSYKCGKQELCYLGPLFYIVSEIIPVTILFLLIIKKNISFTSGALNGFVMYAQVIGFFQIRINSRIQVPFTARKIKRWFVMLYGVYNLQFFTAQDLSFCLHKTANVLDLLMFQYVTVFYSLLLVLFIRMMFSFCNIRQVKKFFQCRVSSIQASIIHGLSAFLVLCFAKCAHISTEVFSYGIIRGKGEKIVKVVVYIYGDYDWMSLDHIKYIIPSITIALFIVILPLVILLTYPVCFKCLAVLKISDKKIIFILCKPIVKMKPFLDSFQGCYKDSCRFFAGLYFLYRVLILLNYSLTMQYYFYIVLEVQLIIMLVLNAVIQPYKRRLYNTIDSLLFANLAIINGISMFNYSQSFSPELFAKNQQIAFIMQEILILLPAACLLLYLPYHVFRKCLKSKLKPKSKIHTNNLLQYCDMAASRNEDLPVKKTCSASNYETFAN